MLLRFSFRRRLRHAISLLMSLTTYHLRLRYAFDDFRSRHTMLRFISCRLLRFIFAAEAEAAITRARRPATPPSHSTYAAVFRHAATPLMIAAIAVTLRC